MKKIILTFLLALSTSFVFSQFGVSYHQTRQSFVGFNYEFKDRFRPEIRIGKGVSEPLFIESALLFDVLNKVDYEAYIGFSFLMEDFNNPKYLVPLGFNFYPFDIKKFGFHIEIAPSFSDFGNELRTSFGIRYRFIK
jgi:hypothetical protein